MVLLPGNFRVVDLGVGLKDLHPSWWLNQPHLKNMLLKLDHFP